MLSNQPLQTSVNHARPSTNVRSVAELASRVQQKSSDVILRPVRSGTIVAAACCNSTNHHRCRPASRLCALPAAEVAQAGEQAAEILAIIGIAFGGVFVALWNVEKQSKQSLEQELVTVKDRLSAAQQQLQDVQQQLAAEQQARKEAESWRGRLDDAQTELFKLEKALEIKDAQLATFMTTAHRQIRSLEDNVKELQKMP